MINASDAIIAWKSGQFGEIQCGSGIFGRDLTARRHRIQARLHRQPLRSLGRGLGIKRRKTVEDLRRVLGSTRCQIRLAARTVAQ